MKLNNILLVFQVILMYTIHILFLVMMLIINNDSMANLNVLIYIFLGLLFVLIANSLYLIILGITNIKKNINNSYKLVMIVKLSLIPWYIINFLIITLLFIGFLNPFLWFAVPILILLGMLLTYLFMIATSMPNISCLISEIIRYKSLKKIIVLIFHFIFCLDVIGSIIV